jgi:uroporphyrinogen decarboxylase
MNARERYRETILFGKPDKVPFAPGGGRESTLRAWRQQGLPEGVNFMDALYEILDIEKEHTQPQVSVGVSFQMIPTFEEKVLEHKDGHYVVQDWMGAITEISDTYDYTYIRSPKDFVTRKWHKFPVQTREDWENMKWRFNPDDPKRFPEDFDERCAKLKDRDYVASIHFNAPFWQLREWCGFEGLCTLMVDDSDFVMEMAGFWTEFVSATMAKILDRTTLDHIGTSEDMAYKEHSMISPTMARKFLQPAYDRWVSEGKAAGVEIFFMDSDGCIDDLIPIWIESGINVASPIEVAAGCDIVEYRRRFGKKMAYTGGIDKRAIAAGGKVMERELTRVVPPLIKDGGFIPGCDHGVPPDISWPNFVEYARLLAKMTGWL